MKMIKAIIRPQSAETVADALAEAGFHTMTKLNAFGRGKQKGLIVGGMHYDELPKVLLMMVVQDENVEQILGIIKESAFTGNFGDGKVFVLPVEAAYTVRTGQAGL